VTAKLKCVQRNGLENIVRPHSKAATPSSMNIALKSPSVTAHSIVRNAIIAIILFFVTHFALVAAQPDWLANLLA
jgi:hypothetical protein